ncbi:hypothetical protein [Paraburkholderia terricola]|uniref:Uncharacterized protein n=1 Tax=Paraburkholderia terricola TaxID=169427 RepID=A0A1M6QZ43_9BURK|nr:MULTISPECIES: hypothetical protein [Paraburkholderia]SDO42762.1 hypothetical protein SAMN05192547_101622 [Paraburkholderia sediminicola]SHK25420.1 hypothetical protein SAMN05192548_101722 [Paraburkholderia terricola]
MPKDNDVPMPVPDPALAIAVDTVPVTFRDRAFRSRTLVLSDGCTLSVEKSTVTASDQEQLALLERHPDFERVADGA